MVAQPLPHGDYPDGVVPPLSAVSYASALNRNELFATTGLHRDIPSVLSPDEEVLLVLPGVAGDFPNVLVVSVRRVLLAAVAGPVRRAKVTREAPVSRVTGVSYRPGAFRRVRVSLAGSRDLRMSPHRSADAERFRVEFERLLRTGRLPR